MVIGNGNCKIDGIGIINGKINNCKINGVGITNGNGKINGIGIINGNSKINGNGEIRHFHTENIWHSVTVSWNS